MKVLEKGTGQKGWSTEAKCTGAGNGNGGCGAKLLVEQPDLFRTASSARDETDYYVTFECAECKVLTDLKGVPGNIERALPSHAAWLKKRAKAESQAEEPPDARCQTTADGGCEAPPEAGCMHTRPAPKAADTNPQQAFGYGRGDDNDDKVKHIDLIVTNADGSDEEGERYESVDKLMKALDDLDFTPTELRWLRYFYEHARHGMGPADSEIYRNLAREYKREGNVLPKDYEANLFGE